MHETTHLQSESHILAALSDTIYQRLLPHLEAVHLPHSELIYEMGEPIKHLYFPFNSLISLVKPMEDGAIIEVGLIGRDGMSGITALMGETASPERAMVQIPDSAVRVKLAVIKEEFNRGQELHALLLDYTRAFINQVSQTAACNAIHTVEERLARWLLMCQDRVQADELQLTHEFISEMLGTRRATVSVAASALQVEGLIQYHRGRVHIVDRQALEEFACECYQMGKTSRPRPPASDL